MYYHECVCIWWQSYLPHPFVSCNNAFLYEEDYIFVTFITLYACLGLPERHNRPICRYISSADLCPLSTRHFIVESATWAQ